MILCVKQVLLYNRQIFYYLQESSYKIMDRQVDFVLRKRVSGWWPRLIVTPAKPAWLKIDFDRWKSEDMDDEEEKRDIRQDYPEMYDKLYKEEFGYRRGEIKIPFLSI